MKLLGLVLVLALALTACNQTDATKNQFKDNNINTTNVSDNANKGKGQAIGKEYGHGRETAYGQVKKIETGQAVPPIAPIEQTFVERMKAKAIEIGLEDVTDVFVFDHAVRIDDIDNSQEEYRLVQEFRKIVEQERAIVRMNEANYTIDGVVKGFEVWYF